MDIISAVFDPELGCTAFTVERITCTRSRVAPAGFVQKSREVAVTYSSGASSSSVSVQTDLADLTETSFGLQLLALLRLYGRSVYVP